jgi:hypothetical protein
MYVCSVCNSPYHYDCLDQSVKLSVTKEGGNINKTDLNIEKD